MARIALVSLVLLAGCDRLDAVEDLTAPVVAQGLYLGIDVPDGVDLAEADEFEYAALCTVFLAYVADPSELADSPVEGAHISFTSPANGTLQFRDEGEGKYTLDSTDGLQYVVGDRPVIRFTEEDDDGRLEVIAPEAPEIDLPSSSKRENPVRVDLSDYTFQNAVAAAYDVDRGKLTWDNLPESVDEIYEFTHSDGPIESLEIPSEAFLRQSTYVVGVAGMEVADPGTFEGVNTSLSALLAGRLALDLMIVTE